ncbi:MAG: PaaI family thioesterase [Planctomycetes bacterium]|nr:PaaI family thioesterase [Planctomycetota bacterium]
MTTEQPTLLPEPDWVELTMPIAFGALPTFVSGGDDTDRLRVRYYFQPKDGRLVGKAWFGPGAQGPPGHAHGGSISALLDEAMGSAAWIDGLTVVAAEITIKFVEMLPLGLEVLFEAWVEKVKGRKVTTAGQVVGVDGTVYGKGTGLFIVIDVEKFKEVLGN